jgi:hypothetical protein
MTRVFPFIEIASPQLLRSYQTLTTRWPFPGAVALSRNRVAWRLSALERWKPSRPIASCAIETRTGTEEVMK